MAKWVSSTATWSPATPVCRALPTTWRSVVPPPGVIVVTPSLTTLSQSPTVQPPVPTKAFAAPPLMNVATWTTSPAAPVSRA